MGGRWLLYFHTVRNLKPSQIFWRVWGKLPVIPAPDAGPPPTLRRSDQPFAGFPAKTLSVVGPDAFRFLNREARVRSAADWNDPQADALWLYNLHYFDDLNARDAGQRTAWQQALLARWLQENPPCSGNGWEPYPTSLRIVNWVKWLTAGNAAPSGIAQSLATQARWLSKRLEWHLLGNHLFANAKALVFAGLFFEDTEAHLWLAKGASSSANCPSRCLPTVAILSVAPCTTPSFWKMCWTW